jgi:TolB-like protein
LTIALLPLQRKGTPASGVNADELVETRLTQALQAGGRLTVVERALLDKVLAELGLGTSDLVDPQAALRVGRLLAARFIATGSVQYIGAKMQLSIRIIETETTATPATEAETVENLEALDSVVQHISRNLLQQLHHAYPLQGRITYITPQGVLLNIGTQHGVTPGLAMQVLQSATPFDLETPIGQILVTHVEARRSQARVLTSSLAIQPGWRVREGQEP